MRKRLLTLIGLFGLGGMVIAVVLVKASLTPPPPPLHIDSRFEMPCQCKKLQPMDDTAFMEEANAGMPQPARGKQQP
jgi:hypothetical protein